MSSGQFNLVVKHTCGEEIPVTVKWSSYPATRLEPGNYDSDYDYPVNCPRCKVDIQEEEAFLDALSKAEDDYKGPYGDEEEWEPEEEM